MYKHCGGSLALSCGTEIFLASTIASTKLDLPIVPVVTAGPEEEASDKLETFEMVPLIPVTLPKSVLDLLLHLKL